MRSSDTGRPEGVLRLVSGIMVGCLALSAAELGFRIFWIKRLTVAAGLEHPHFHHRLKPSSTYHYFSPEFDVTIQTNRHGLRGSDPVIPKPAGVVRILMLGDSMTFGFPVRDGETFCHLIEQGLRAKGVPVEVINGGVSGYSPVLEYLSLRDEFLIFEPDLVIQWRTPGDTQEDFWYKKNLIRDEQGKILRADPRYVNGRFDQWEWLKNHSAIAKYVENKLIRTIGKIRILGLWGYVRTVLKGERAKVAIARLKTAEGSEALPEYDRFFLYRESATVERVKPYWMESAHYVLMMRDLLAERGILFARGYLPLGMVVGPDQWAEGRVAWGFEKGKTYDGRVALAIYEQFSQEASIPFINPLERFRKAAETEKLFYDHDGHLTPAGHRVVAEALQGDTAFQDFLSRLRPPS